MDKRTLTRLSYHTILEQLAGCSVSSLGRERAQGLLPITDLETIKHWQAETTQGRDLLRLEPLAEVGGWQDIRQQVMQAGHGLVLEPGDLLSVARTLTASRRVRKFLLDRQEQYPLLYDIGIVLGQFDDIEQKIYDAIGPNGEVSDQASPELARINRSLANLQAQIKSKLDQFIRSQTYQKYLQDPIVTLRDNRYVIPVKQEYRAQIPGIVHDQSASGATLFIEPMAVVEANNEIRRLEIAQKQEIARILAMLSSGLSLRQEELMITLDALGHLDFVMAKARYSLRLNACEPDVLPLTQLELKKARHPLLTGDVVPIDVQLGQDFHTIIITGPNTGGKTVTLKTIGLLVLMAQSGLHIPVNEGSQVGVFQNVFADIGDEQSIEQSLSTFSSHMKNIVEIIEQKGPDCLILLDELGAGTDPAEGSALAQAILQELHDAGASIVATTHYGDLKQFAYDTRGVENASVEFDSVSLKPTYRLLIGTPGRSNAFEISLRLGLYPGVVDRAREYMGEEQIKVSDLVDALEKQKQQSEQAREEAEHLRQEAETLRNRYRDLEQNLRERRAMVLEKAREEARALVKEAKAESEDMIRHLREKLSQDTAREREMGIQEARQRLKGMQNKVYTRASKKQVPSKAADIALLMPGKEVFLPQYNQKGFILSPPAGDQVQVQVGIMKINVPVSSVCLVHEKEETKGKTRIGDLMSGKAKDISTKLDMRGKTFDEAWLEIEKYLDDALLAGLPKVYLVHGKGTGALRASVQQALKGHPRVKSFRLGEVGEGGSGVTVVDLK